MEIHDLAFFSDPSPSKELDSSAPFSKEKEAVKGTLISASFLCIN